MRLRYQGICPFLKKIHKNFRNLILKTSKKYYSVFLFEKNHKLSFATALLNTTTLSKY